MKSKYFSIILAALAFASCAYNDVDNIDTSLRHGSFTALTETGETRTQMGSWNSTDSRYPLLWSEGDKLRLYAGGSTADCTITAGAGTSTASFNSSLTGESYVALYPSTVAGSLSGTTLTLTLPATQSYSPAGIGNGALPMIAVSSSTTMEFKNLCAVLRISLTGDFTVTAIEVAANTATDCLSGEATVSTSYTSIPSLAMKSGGSSSVSLDCGSGVALSTTTATDFHIVIPAQQYTGGITLTITTPDGTMTKPINTTFTAVRSMITPVNQFEVSTLPVGNIDFADANFKAALLLLTVDGYVAANYPAKTRIDANSDGEISYAEAAEVTKITVNTYTANITSMSGIEYFINITSLICTGTLQNIGGLTSLDVSANTKLQTLYCHYNKLTSLDVRNNTVLTSFGCHYNQLTALDVSKNKALTFLNCCYNQLATLNTINCTTLATLYCYSNQLSALDVSSNTALTYLRCYSNQLTALDLSNNTALTVLQCYSNQLTALDLSKNTALTDLLCYSNQLTALDLSKNTALEYLSCYSNKLTALDLSKNTALEYLSCYSNQLTTLDVSKTNLHNSPYADPLDCSPMNDASGNNLLATLYVAEGQVVNYINGTSDYVRNDKYVPAATLIVEGDGSDLFKLSQNAFTVGSTGGSIDVTVTAGMTYSISSIPDWITETTAAGTRAVTSKTHTFNVATNTGSSERSGVIVFCYNSQCVSVSVTQAAAVGEDDTWKSKEFWHRSLAMKFTATWCGYCPYLSNTCVYAQSLVPDQIEILNLHVSGSDLAFAGTTTLYEQYSAGTPSAYVDGRIYIPNYSNTGYGATQIINASDQTATNYSTSTGIAFSTTLSGSSLSAVVRLYVKKSGSYKVNAVLVEDGIVNKQSDYDDGTNSNYVHNDIARLSLTDISGEPFTTSVDNQIVEKSYSVTIPSSYNSSNMRLLVYVQRAFGSQTVVQSGSYGDYYVDNCRSQSLGTAAQLQYADDSSLGRFYSSSSYSANGTVTKLQSATVGNGIDLVITGDAFADTDMSLFDTYASKAMEAFFAEEPFTTYRNRFNVYSVKAVSQNNVIKTGNTTKFSVSFGSGTRIDGNLTAVNNFVNTALPSVDLTKALIMVLVNARTYAGTCHFYSNNQAIAFTPIGPSNADFVSIFQHESCGHGFGKLADEYFDSDTTITDDDRAEYTEWSQYSYGFYENVDITNSTTDIRWASFLADSRYSGQVGIYEGAYLFNYGAYRATDESIMRYNKGGFNAPSREAIYKKIMRFSEGDSWTYNYETFVAYDAVNRSSSSVIRRNSQARSVDTDKFVPLAPPVRHLVR